MSHAANLWAAEASLSNALKAAQDRQALFFEIRAATDLARLRLEQAVLRRRVWLRNLIVALREVSLHQGQAGKSAVPPLVLRFDADFVCKCREGPQ